MQASSFSSWQTLLAFFLFVSSGKKYAKIFDIRHIAMHLFLVEVRNRKKKNGHFRFTLFQAKEQQCCHHQPMEKKNMAFWKQAPPNASLPANGRKMCNVNGTWNCASVAGAAYVVHRRVNASGGGICSQEGRNKWPNDIQKKSKNKLQIQKWEIHQ